MSKDIKVGDWVKVTEPTCLWFGQEFKVAEVVTTDYPSRHGKRFVNGDKEGAGVWLKFITKIDDPTKPKPALDFVDDARQQIVSAVFSYRKELIGELDLNRDARPIVQAKLSAVNEILARLQP